MIEPRRWPSLFRLLVLLLLLTFKPSAAALESWMYCAQNLWVDKNLDELESLMRRAAKAGYTHVLLSDSKFAKLGDMDTRYFRNIDRVKRVADETRLEIVPAVFPIGYSNDLLWHDPNLVESLPVRAAPFLVQDGVARLHSTEPALLKGGDFSDLRKWDWKDTNVVADDGAARMADLNGANARIVQRIGLHPFRQYHLTARIKTREFRGQPEVKILAGNFALDHNHLGVKASQEWTTHHVVFNSLNHTQANLYLGCWGGGTGAVWWDDATLEEVALVNLVRRDGAPLVVQTEAGATLMEGRDFPAIRDPKMGVRLWPGSYDVWHEPPIFRIAKPDGTRLRVSYYHAVTVNDDQAMVCSSEPRTVELLRDQAQRMHRAWGARGYMMSHDEIRVLNWCDACQRRGLEAGALLADNARTCVKLLREVNPGGRIYVWSDMFDPNHNARRDYYLVRGDLAGSWEGLDSEVIIVPWYFERRAQSLKFFADRGHRQVIAGYYDAAPERVRDWLTAAKPLAGVQGVMYTTWRKQYRDLERFAEVLKANDSKEP